MSKTAAPLAERIRDSIVINDTGCWVWQKITQSGYGMMHVGSWTDGTRRVCRAHRVSYETFVGPIPDGLHIDHLCRNRACVNPEHLEAVTPTVNARRRAAAQGGYQVCPRGHRRTPETVVIINGKRACRTCTGALS